MITLYRNQIRQDRNGHYYFRCRVCKVKGSIHYYEVSAINDKERHTCAE